MAIEGLYVSRVRYTQNSASDMDNLPIGEMKMEVLQV